MSDKVFRFPNQYDKHERLFTNSGETEHIIYSSRYNERGEVELFESGKENIPEMINSYAESCDINSILKRYESGDVGVLNQRQGVFIDAVDMPHSYAELLNTVIEGEQKFNSLPLEVREKFNHSYAEWIAQTDSPEWFEKMGLVKPVEKPVETVEKGVEVNES